MFILDGFGRERPVPVGAYFPDRSMRNDQHDAVATQLLIPISRIRPWLQRPEGGAPQPAEAPSDAESDSDQDTPEQGVSEGQLCAVSIERVQGGPREASQHLFCSIHVFSPLDRVRLHASK